MFYLSWIGFPLPPVAGKEVLVLQAGGLHRVVLEAQEQLGTARVLHAFAGFLDHHAGHRWKLEIHGFIEVEPGDLFQFAAVGLTFQAGEA